MNIEKQNKISSKKLKTQKNEEVHEINSDP